MHKLQQILQQICEDVLIQSNPYDYSLGIAEGLSLKPQTIDEQKDIIHYEIVVIPEALEKR